MIIINDEESYRKVVDDFSEMIFRIAYQNLFNREDSEDIVQDVFLTLLKNKKKTFNGSEHLKAWLIKVTVNKCIDLKRKLMKKQEFSLEDFDLPLEPAEQKILSEISLLPKDERNILYLYYYEDYSIKEIAAILKRNQNTINSKLTRARKKLKKLILEANENEML